MNSERRESPTQHSTQHPTQPATPRLLEITEDSFAEAVLASPLPVLVDFTAVWCAPCRAIAPHLLAMAQTHAGRLRVGKVDVDENRELAARYDVRSMPTLLLFDRGQVVGQIVGAVPRARIEALVAPHLAPARADADASSSASVLTGAGLR